MGIDTAFLERIISIGNQEKIFPGGDVLILGDCTFYTNWSTGDNVKDREYLKRKCNLNSIETIDINGNPSIIMDLSARLPDIYLNRFDMIIDAGTIFCCFDVANVLRNCFLMMRDDAVIINQSGLTGYYGRCYYNIHPAMYWDLYEQNGFSVLAMDVRVFKEPSLLSRMQRWFYEIINRPYGVYKPIPKGSTFVEHANLLDITFGPRYKGDAWFLPTDALLVCAARRHQRKDFKNPQPGYYNN